MLNSFIIKFNQSAMIVGCGYKINVKYREHKSASS